MGKYFKFFKITEETTIGLRVLIGALIHIIELVIVFFNTSKTFTPINGVSKHGLIIAVFVLIILFAIASIAYLASAILNRKKENFDLFINKRNHRNTETTFLKLSSIQVFSSVLCVKTSKKLVRDKGKHSFNTFIFIFVFSSFHRHLFRTQLIFINYHLSDHFIQ